MSLLTFLGWNIAGLVFGALTLAAFSWLLMTDGGIATALSLVALLVCATATIFTALRTLHRS